MQTPLRSWVITIGIIVGLIAGIVAVGLLRANDSNQDPVATSSSPGRSRTARATSTPRPASSYRVTYRVTTSRSQHDISLTYTNASGNTEQMDTSSLNYEWERAFTMAPGEFVYLSAQSGETSGSVECEILVNGRVIEQAKSSGQYVIASCSGSVPRS